MPRALSIYLPRWPLTRVLRKRSQALKADRRIAADPHEHQAALLVSTRDRNKRIAVCCEKAEAAGVRAGMSLAHARSLLVGHRVWVQPFAPDEDARDLEKLAGWATRFTPVVAVDPPDGLFLDIAGCEHLFGGEERLAEQIVASLGQIELPCKICIAPTFACAQAVARYGSHRMTFVRRDDLCRALVPLPVAALRMDPAVCEALNEVGVERIHQLLEIPREELAGRFGGELLRRVDQALGAVCEPIEPLLVREPIVVVRSFDGPVTSIEAVMTVTRELLSALVGELEKKADGLSFLRIRFRRINVDPVDLVFSPTYPTRDSVHLWSLIQPKMERIHLGYGVEEIRLHAERTARLIPEQKELGPDWVASSARVDDSHLGKLVDQLIDHLGRQSVTRILPLESYLPERAFHQQPLDEACPRQTGGVYLASRPSRLFASPESVNVVALLPDGPPAWLEWRGQGCPVRSTFGPERIAPPWWERDLSAGARDYYEVQDELGRWLWIFRDRGTSHDQPAVGRWFVHGEWA